MHREETTPPDTVLGIVRQQDCGEGNKEAYFMGFRQIQNYNKDEAG